MGAHRSAIFVIFSLIFYVNVTYAFLYDDFSNSFLDTAKWNISCLGGCPADTGLNPNNQTFRFTPTEASYLYLTGHKFSYGDTLDFDIYYNRGRLGFQYGDYPPYPSFFPPNNVLPSSGLYHMQVEFLRNRIRWEVYGQNDFYQNGEFEYSSINPIFYPSEADGDVSLDNFVINKKSSPQPLRLELSYNKSIIAINNARYANYTINNNYLLIDLVLINLTKNCGKEPEVVKTDTSVWIFKFTTAYSDFCYFDIRTGKLLSLTGDGAQYVTKANYANDGEIQFDSGLTINVKYADSSLITISSPQSTNITSNFTINQLNTKPNLSQTAFCGDNYCNDKEDLTNCFSDCNQQIYLPIFLGLLGIGSVVGYRSWKKHSIDDERKRKIEEKRLQEETEKETRRLKREEKRLQGKKEKEERLEKVRIKREERNLERFEKDLIAKKRVSPLNTKDLYFDQFAKKYGLGSEKERERLGKILGKRHIESSKSLEMDIESHFEKLQIKKGLEKFTDEEGNVKWGTPEQVKKWKEIDLGLGDNFQSIHWSDFEKMMGTLLEKMGYKNINVTRRTGDYGIDIVAKKRNSLVAVQCKKWKGGVVGNKDIRDAIAGAFSYSAKKLIFITSAKFTKEAIEQTRMANSSLSIELWDRDKLKELIREWFIERQ